MDHVAGRSPGRGPGCGGPRNEMPATLPARALAPDPDSSYGLQYHELAWREIPHRSDLALVLVVPSFNQALADELACLDCHLRPLGNGYAVSEAEQDDFLRIFSHHAVQTREAHHWLQDWITRKETMPDVKQREGHDEIIEKLIRSMPPEKVLRNIKPEDRLAGLPPEQRLAGLPREQQILALSDEVLRGLPDDYIGSLPRDVQQVIRRRLDQGK